MATSQKAIWFQTSKEQLDAVSQMFHAAAIAPRESKAGPIAASGSRKRAAAAGRAVIEALARSGIRRSVPCAYFRRSHYIGRHTLPG